MPRIPHFYTLRENTHSEVAFAAFVDLIKSHGYDQKFYSKTFRYLDLDGWCYWTMGLPTESTGGINRAETHREDYPIVPNPVPAVLQDWPEVWCPARKKMIPKQPGLGL